MADYIERKAALAKTCEGCIEANGGTCEHKCADYCAIAELPTADVVEVRHGKFVDEGGNSVNSFDYHGRACDKWGRALYRPIYCSECHICLAGMNGKLYPHQRNYCSNCGAKMNRKDEE